MSNSNELFVGDSIYRVQLNLEDRVSLLVEEFKVTEVGDYDLRIKSNSNSRVLSKGYVNHSMVNERYISDLSKDSLGQGYYFASLSLVEQFAPYLWQSKLSQFNYRLNQLKKHASKLDHSYEFILSFFDIDLESTVATLKKIEEEVVPERLLIGRNNIYLNLFFNVGYSQVEMLVDTSFVQFYEAEGEGLDCEILDYGLDTEEDEVEFMTSYEITFDENLVSLKPYGLGLSEGFYHRQLVLVEDKNDFFFISNAVKTFLSQNQNLLNDLCLKTAVIVETLKSEFSLGYFDYDFLEEKN